MSLALARATKAAIDRDGTAVTLVEIVQTPGGDPWDLTDVQDGLTAAINGRQGPVTTEQFASGNTKTGDVSLYLPGLDVPTFFDDTSKVEIGGERFNVIQIDKHGTDAALVGVVALIRR